MGFARTISFKTLTSDTQLRHDTAAAREAAFSRAPNMRGNKRISKLPSKTKTPGEAAKRKVAAVNYGALTGSIGFLLKRVQLVVMADAIATLAPLKLRPAQFSVLVLIDANEELAQSELCAALSIQRANFVAMLDELEARGLTKRCVSTRDRRINTVALTAEGRRVLALAVKMHAVHEAKLLERLGDKGRSQLAILLGRLIH
jgi:DNA-binding MarR family transcriptional regulator